MTDRLSALLHEEAERLVVPMPVARETIRARFARCAISSLVIEGPEEMVSDMPTILGEATDRSRTASIG